MSKIENIPFDELVVGQTATHTHTVTEEDILLFARVSGDVNPIHLDEEYAATTEFGGRIAHGMFTGALISAALALNLPGPGSVYMGQTLKFLAPVRPGDMVYAEVKVVDIEFAKRRVKLDCHCSVDGKKVLIGEAMVLAPSRKFD